MDERSAKPSLRLEPRVNHLRWPNAGLEQTGLQTPAQSRTLIAT